MPSEKITQLPTVASSLTSDIIYAVQNGTSVQETLAQVLALSLSQTILHNLGNPNGSLAGQTYQLCYDITNNVLYVCTTTGSASTAVWTALQITLIPATQGGTGVSSPTAHTIPVAEGSSAFHFLGPLTDGQLLIGSTGADPVPHTLTAGTNVSISNSAGTITINATGEGGFTWNNVTGTSASMAVANGYISNNAGLVTLTLPASSAVGDRVGVVGNGAGGWKVAQHALQNIQVGSSSTAVGTGGYISSTNRYDSISLVCTVANTTWVAYSAPQGNLNIV